MQVQVQRSALLSPFSAYNTRRHARGGAERLDACARQRYILCKSGTARATTQKKKVARFAEVPARYWDSWCLRDRPAQPGPSSGEATAAAAVQEGAEIGANHAIEPFECARPWRYHARRATAQGERHIPGFTAHCPTGDVHAT